jgi:hypothetical protein
MEGIKSYRPQWINKIQKQLANDIKYGHDPTLNIRNEYFAMESGEASLNDLEIKLTVQKDPIHYPHNRLQRIVGTELSATQGETIRFFKSDVVIRGGTSNPLVSLGGSSLYG